MNREFAWYKPRQPKRTLPPGLRTACRMMHSSACLEPRGPCEKKKNYKKTLADSQCGRHNVAPTKMPDAIVLPQQGPCYYYTSSCDAFRRPERAEFRCQSTSNMIEESSTPAKISTQAVGITSALIRFLSTRGSASQVGKGTRTHSIHLYVVEQREAHEAAAEHLYLAKPFPPGRMPSGGTVEEYARIIRVARGTRA